MEACRILYSTQSGRAKACARRIARRLRDETTVLVENRSGDSFDQHIQDLASFTDTVRQRNVYLVLIVSTAGDGEHTDTIKRTWSML